jgi:hypothetical protein
VVSLCAIGRWFGEVDGDGFVGFLQHLRRAILGGGCLEYILGQTEELPAYSRTEYMKWIPRGRNILEWLELSYVSITAIILGTQYGKGSYIRQGLIDFEAHHRLLEFCLGMLEAAL